MTERRPLIGLLLISMLAACSQPGAAIPTPSTSASLAAGPPSASSTPETATAVPPPTPTASTPPPPVAFKGGDTAVVLADAVRMRAEPSTDNAATRLAMLPKGTQLYVLDGPRQGSGYDWYQVAPIATSKAERWGWVPVASRDGAPWLASGTAACPPKPSDVRAVSSLDFGTAVACFGGQAITFGARVLPLDGSIDPGENIRPAMFQYRYAHDDGATGLGGGPILLTPKGTAPGTGSVDEDLLLRLADKAPGSSPLPIGDDVIVTGMFDHPAAADCRADEDYDGNREPSPVCRGFFLVTSIR